MVLVDLDMDRLARLAGVLRSELQTSLGHSVTEDVVLTVQADVTADEDVKRFVNKATQKFRRLDIAFLCAGTSHSSTSILEADVDQYDKVMRVNCRSGGLYSPDTQCYLI